MSTTEKKTPPIKYTSREFASIKNDLVNYAKRYYPDTFQDFSSPSFGSLMLDTVSYVGDMLSFYLDYQANESFLSTANEYENLIKLGRQMGYKFQWSPTSQGILTLYVLVPASDSTNAPDTSYMPLLLKGSKFTTGDGNSFTLVENIDFSAAENEVVAAKQDPAGGGTTSYAVKARGKVVSGRFYQDTIAIGDYTKFLRVPLTNANITEVVSVIDSQGHEYFEVDHLSQNIVYVPVSNTGTDKSTTPAILKTIAVPRRFTVERMGANTFLQFGYGSETEVEKRLLTHPSNVALKQHARSYITDESLDPSVLNKSDKFGVVPANTTLTITYRANNVNNVNASADTVTQVTDALFKFTSTGATSAGSISDVKQSLEVTNELPIVGDVSIPNTDELKQRIAGNFAAQNRAVTREDYVSLTYQMPQQFGAIKRCNIVQDSDSFKRNLNLFVVSEDNSGKLIETNNTIKQNLKTWLNQYKMINDTVDILDARIANIGIDFVVVGDIGINKFDILNSTNGALIDLMNVSRDLGEPFYITDLYQILNNVPGVVDTVDIKLTNKIGGVYSSLYFNLNEYTSPDGRFVTVPEDTILEIKYPNTDIRGTVK